MSLAWPLFRWLRAAIYRPCLLIAADMPGAAIAQNSDSGEVTPAFDWWKL